MTDIKSRETLVAELRQFMRNYNRRVDITDNSLAKDIIIIPYSVGGEAIMDQVSVARDLGILSKLDTAQLDDEATNYQKERLPGNAASVTLVFYTNSVPTTDIIIPAGTQASTVGSSFVSPVTYSTIGEARFSLADVASYFSYDRDRYEFPVTALCDSIGAIGNVGANLIIKQTGSIAGINGVTNILGASGGSDEELNDDIRLRIQLAKIGRDLNTVNGLRGYLKDLAFLDAYPIRVESSDAERATGIDAFAINLTSTQIQETFTYDPSQERYYFTNRPVLEVTSVVGSNSGTLSASEFDAYIDNSSPMRRSVYAMDYIVFRPAAALLVGEQVTVTYNYASLVKNVQDTLQLNANNVLTADPLIKRAIPLYLYITAQLTLMANADGAATRNKVRNALSQFLAGYRLGDDIQKSDLLVVMQEGYGDYPIDSVDAVILSSYTLRDSEGNVRSPVDEVISVTNKEYVVYGQATIT